MVVFLFLSVNFYLPNTTKEVINLKKILFSLAIFLSTPISVLANGDHAEETGIGAQLNELLPFEHIGEGHWVAFTLSLILWVSLIYTIYTLVKQFTKK